MPSGLATRVRDEVANLDKTGLVLERNPYSKTGFTNVIKVKGKFQARLQVKGDRVGGTRKRRQYSLPGLFRTAQEAAEYLALVKETGLDHVCDEDGVPKKQNKEHKVRSQPQPKKPVAALPLQPVQTHVATVMAMPMAFPMMQLPLAAANAASRPHAACVASAYVSP